MRNIRLDKLPANRQTATQGKSKAVIRLSSYADYLGCQVCTRRRIKCDRTLPACKKCSSRGLSCPGYNLLLRWNQGVASRGKLTGKNIPLPSPKKPSEQSHISAEGTAILSHDSGSVITNRVADPEVLFQRAGRISDLVTNIHLFGRYSSHALGEILLNHFNTEVACQLAWLDGPGNPWRNLVLPLAQRSTCLHLSILGLAAAHMSIKSTDGNAATILQACYRFRDASLLDLNMKLNSELGRSSETAAADFDTSSLIDMITTMVSLCYGELLIPNSVNWRLHLRACRASLDRYNRQTHRHQELISQFLIEEVTYLETFGTICFFADTPSRRLPTQSWSISDDCFWRFTELVNATTAVERDRFRTLEDGNQPPDTNMGIWKSKLVEAFDSACASMNSGFVQDAATQTCLGSVIRAHYYACLIYIYQAIASQKEAEESIPLLIDSLFDEIMLITAWPVRTVSHDASFPLFIAGTECHWSLQRQSVIHDLFVESVSATGFSCNDGVLQFLRAYWAAPPSGNWIHYARENEPQISPFIVF